jgi:Mannosyltransferase (PIG-V)
MSATSPEFAYRARASRRRLTRVWVPLGAPVRALLVSRLLVLGAGAAGALFGHRQFLWATFDPWKLSDHLGAVGNVLAASAVRWDSIHYLLIAEHGYAAPASTVFYPLYPLLVRSIGFLIGSDAAAGIAISLASFWVALTLLHRLTKLELGPRAADATVLLLAFAPLSFFFSAVYTESLFLALSLGSFYAARRGRWRLAAVLGGLAAPTRVTGIVLALPLAVMYLQERRRLDRGLAWLLLVPTGLGAYLAYLMVKGYGFLAPIHEQVTGHQHQLGGPVDTIVAAVRAASAGLRWVWSQPVYAPDVGGVLSSQAESIMLLGVLAIAVVALVATFRRLNFAYSAYSLAVLLVCTWSPVINQPLQSFDRYALTIFPLWMAAGAWVSERRLTRTLIVISGALLAFWTFQFATWAWVA